MTTVNIHEAKTQLSKLVERALQGMDVERVPRLATGDAAAQAAGGGGATASAASEASPAT